MERERELSKIASQSVSHWSKSVVKLVQLPARLSQRLCQKTGKIEAGLPARQNLAWRATWKTRIKLRSVTFKFSDPFISGSLHKPHLRISAFCFFSSFCNFLNKSSFSDSFSWGFSCTKRNYVKLLGKKSESRKVFEQKNVVSHKGSKFMCYILFFKKWEPCRFYLRGNSKESKKAWILSRVRVLKLKPEPPSAPSSQIPNKKVTENM